jgi:hypothetical protein
MGSYAARGIIPFPLHEQWIPAEQRMTSHVMHATHSAPRYEVHQTPSPRRKDQTSRHPHQLRRPFQPYRNCDVTGHSTAKSLNTTMHILCLKYLLNEIQIWRPGFDHRQKQRIFTLTSVFRPALRPTQPPIHRYWGSIPMRKCAPGTWRWPLTPSNAKVKNK